MGSIETTTINKTHPSLFPPEKSKNVLEKVHESLWKGANQKWNHGGLYRKQRMLYNKEKTSEQVTAAKTRRDTKDEQLKAYLKELGVGKVSKYSKNKNIKSNFEKNCKNRNKMILNFQMDQVLSQKQSLHQRKEQRESRQTRQLLLLRDVLDERENVNYLRLCQDPFQIRKNQNNDFHLEVNQ